MKFINFKYLLTIALFCAVTSIAFSQEDENEEDIIAKEHGVQTQPKTEEEDDIFGNEVGFEKTISVGGGLGLASYFGDLCDGGECMRFRHSLTAAVIYRFSERVAARAELSHFKLYGDDKFGRNWNRNLNFKSNNIAFLTEACYDLFTQEKIIEKNIPVMPFVYGGVGIMRFNPKGYLPSTDQWYKLQPLMTEGYKYKRTTLVLPYGAGVKYQMNSAILLNVEGGYHMAFTDYLDDVSTNYVDNNTFTDPTAKEIADKNIKYPSSPEYRFPDGHQRGNPSASDGYFVFSIKIEYLLNSGGAAPSPKMNLEHRPKFEH